MDFKVGDYVTRNSHQNDIIFKIIKIDNEKLYLKGIDVRLFADCLLSDAKICNEYVSDKFESSIDICDDLNLDRSNDFFYLPGKILHIDGDADYLKRCLNFYKDNNILAIGKRINEENMSSQITDLLKKIKPDILVITGHDAYLKESNSPDSKSSYRNSHNFIKTVIEARKYEKSHEKLFIFAGACQSNYEELIKAGANYASSPKRINIHALDPAIVASTVAFTEKSKQVNLFELLNKTKYGKDGVGGIIGNGYMYVGYPR